MKMFFNHNIHFYDRKSTQITYLITLSRFQNNRTSHMRTCWTCCSCAAGIQFILAEDVLCWSVSKAGTSLLDDVCCIGRSRPHRRSQMLEMSRWVQHKLYIQPSQLRLPKNDTQTTTTSTDAVCCRTNTTPSSTTAKRKKILSLQVAWIDLALTAYQVWRM